MLMRRIPSLFIAGTLSLLAAASVIGAGNGSDSDTAPEKSLPATQSSASNPFAGTPAAADAGRQLFLQTGCYNCHGADAKGGGIAPDLTASKLDAQQMFKTIHDGRTGTLMPSWGKQLDAEQIWKIVTYLRSVKHDG
jgi:mono/diheme cytochrome c family protein